ncbi:MAG: PAS domain S-box protein [Planctomycetales bacterium]|nr:PAS domain S-box protein [Planctomycetales bacterium]
MIRSLNWLIGLLVGASIAAIVALAAVTYVNTQASLESERAVSRTQETTALLSKLLLTFRDAETGQRGYLLTADEEYLAPYVESLSRARKITLALKARFADRADQLRRLEAVAKLTEQKHEELAKTIELRRSKTPDAYDKAVQILLGDESRTLMADISATINELTTDEERFLHEQTIAAKERAEFTVLSIVIGNGLALGLVSAAGYAMRYDRDRRKLAEANLTTERERLEAIVNSAMVGIVAFDQRLDVVLANPAALAILGCSEDEVLGENYLRFVPVEDRPQAERMLRGFFQQSQVHHTFARQASLRFDGGSYLAEGSLTKVTPEGVPLLTMIFRDLTDEETQRAKARHQAAVLDQVRDAVHIRDAEGRITYWNQGSTQLYGWTAEEAVGKRVSDLMSPERLPAHDKAEAAIAADGVWLGEITQFTKDGREIIAEQRRSELRDESGEVAGLLVINTDVTEQKKAEQLERRNQRLDSIGTLVGGIAHDLNNVLTPIVMGAKLLEREQPPESRQQLLSTIHASAERGAEMIRQLLSFAGGRRSEQVQSVHVCPVVRELVGILRHTLPKSIQIETDCTADLWSVRCDPTELSQVLMNLSINARDAMPDGGTLTIQGSNVRFQDTRPTGAAELPPGPYVCLSISDTGHGIPKEVIDKVFDPFFTTKQQGKGTGLGLSTSLGIVKSYGGAMHVYSEVGNGTKFILYLPTDQKTADAQRGQDSLDFPQGSGDVVLLIDDEPLLLEVARATLESNGYHALVAGGGAEGVAVFQAQHENLAAVIVDMMMPGLDGQATIDAMRQISRGVPIIASSGLRRPDSGEHRIRDAQEFLSKPYTDQQLLAMVRRVIDEQAAHS